MQLTQEQMDRYLHHIVLKDVGGEGQRKLLASRVLIVGAGGLGSASAFYLAAAGVGTVGLCDDDSVELSNLQRQIIHSTKDLGRPKVESASEKMRALNPDVNVAAHKERLDASNAGSIIADYDFVINGTDNFPAKFLISDTCVAIGRAFAHGGAVGFRGQAFTHIPGSMCLRCIFPEPPGPGTIQD
ncbi:MAG: HesA/MoeB/ThiF family protein, partial [Pseudomonadota bacterium]